MEKNEKKESKRLNAKFRICPSKALYRVGFSSRRGISIPQCAYYETYNEGLDKLKNIHLPNIYFDVRKTKCLITKKYFVPIKNDYYFLERVYRDKRHRIIRSEVREKIICYREERFYRLSDKKRKTYIEIVDYVKNQIIFGVYIKKLDNKILFSGDFSDCLICKDVEDCKRLYYMLKDDLFKLVDLYFMGDIKENPTETLKKLGLDFGVNVKNMMFVKRSRI